MKNFSVTAQVVALVMMLGILSTATYLRNFVWQTHSSLWEDAAEKSPAKARPYYNYGVYLQKYGQLDKALELYSKAIMLDPQKGEALVNRGNIYDEMLLSAKALEDYNRAIAVNPSDESAFYNRGVTYERLGRLDEAIADYRRSCDLQSRQGCMAFERLLQKKNR